MSKTPKAPKTPNALETLSVVSDAGTPTSTHTSRRRSPSAEIVGVARLNRRRPIPNDQHHNPQQQQHARAGQGQAASSSLREDPLAGPKDPGYALRLGGFYKAKEEGKKICICGASALCERERVHIKSLLQELRAKEKVVAEREVEVDSSEQVLHHRLTDIQRRENELDEREKDAGALISTH